MGEVRKGVIEGYSVACGLMSPKWRVKTEFWFKRYNDKCVSVAFTTMVLLISRMS